MQPSSPSYPSPFTASTMLILFSERKVELTRAQFDQYFDEVCALLERANNESYRLHEPEAP